MITKKTCTSYGILYLTSLDLKIYSKYSKSKLSLFIDHLLSATETQWQRNTCYWKSGERLLIEMQPLRGWGRGGMVVVKWKSLSHVQLFATPCNNSPWNCPGQNTGVGSRSLLQGIFSTQGLNPGLPHCRRILYQLSHQGSLGWRGDPIHLPGSREELMWVLHWNASLCNNWLPPDCKIRHS